MKDKNQLFLVGLIAAATTSIGSIAPAQALPQGVFGSSGASSSAFAGNGVSGSGSTSFGYGARTGPNGGLTQTNQSSSSTNASPTAVTSTGNTTAEVSGAGPNGRTGAGSVSLSGTRTIGNFSVGGTTTVGASAGIRPGQ